MLQSNLIFPTLLTHQLMVDRDWHVVSEGPEKLPNSDEVTVHTRCKLTRCGGRLLLMSLVSTSVSREL